MTEPDRVLTVMDVYNRFLRDLDTWFRAVRVKYGERMQCRKGCAQCCYGLFDVSVPDAFRVAEGYHRLAPSLRNNVLHRSTLFHSQLIKAVPELKNSFFLNQSPKGDIDRLSDRFDAVRCPFLDSDDDCLIYESRPLACVLEGIPMVDACNGLFDDWCRLNFTSGIDKAVETDLALDCFWIDATVQSTTEGLMERIPSIQNEETTVFLPSIIVAFEAFWKGLLD